MSLPTCPSLNAVLNPPSTRNSQPAFLPPTNRRVFNLDCQSTLKLGETRRISAPSRFRSRARDGFTLIELLTVATVLAILTALTIPSLRDGIGHARRMTCRSNLHQWGLATHLYAADHADALPPEGPPNAHPHQPGWYVHLPQTLGIPTYHEMPWRNDPSQLVGRSLWICPANTNRSNGYNLFHYCANQSLDGTGDNDRPLRLGDVETPHRAVWLFENRGRAAVARPNNAHTNLHQRGAHFLFLDGSVRGFASPAYWDFDRGRGRTNNPEIVWSPSLLNGQR